MYIYESHMGGLFASDEELDYDVLYCDSCGDSDSLIGHADSAEEAWNLLIDNTATFDEDVCKNCSHKEDYEYCDNQCTEYSKSGGYAYSYISEFIYDTFNIKDKVYYILMAKHKDCEDMIFVNCKVNGYEFGQKYMVPIKPILSFDSLRPLFKAEDLTLFLDDYVGGSLKEVATKKIDGKTFVLFSCLSDEKGEDWKESAHSCDDGWYGYMKVSDIEDNFYDKKILEFIKEYL